MDLTDKKFLSLAVKQAKLSVEKGGFPAGAVLVKEGKVIAKGISVGFLLHDPTAHAETASIRQACKKLQTTDLTGVTLYASLQPCLLCYSTSNWANLDRIVYGCQKTDDMVAKHYYEGNNDLEKINLANTHQISLEFYPDFESQMLELVRLWETK